MSDSPLREPKQFGQRNAPKTISISSNGKTRQFAINPAIVIISACLFCMFMVGYMGSTAYLAFRDDLISSSFVRQARIKHEYEDRIAALRSKVDKITSRQMLDQQAVEAQVSELMRQQALISGQNGQLNGILERAKKSGVGTTTIPVPSSNPKKADLGAIDPFKTGSINSQSTNAPLFAGTFLRGAGSSTFEASKSTQFSPLPSQNLFGSVGDQIRQIRRSQYASLRRVDYEAREKGRKIASILSDLNVPVSKQSMKNIGGPFEEARADGPFKDAASGLTATLDALDNLRLKARKVPVSAPLKNAPISSLFGNRVDPFHRSRAFHAGIDYRAKTGTPILATADGVVKKAARNGGYGKMVILDHGNGITTRYAHMSRISVKVGQYIARGTKIGAVGSTGRSTGPHLHYEVRRNEKATNPSKFLEAGRRLSKLL